jgi:hypothetical protein
VLLWRHARLGRIEVPLNVVASIQLKASPPPVSARDADLVELANGDRLEGFVTGISDSLLIEIEPEDDAGQVRSLAVPFANIASVTMVSPPRNREGTRVWLRDGTIFRVDSIRIGDDGFMRLAGPWITDAAEPWELSDLAAVVFDSSAIIPLASLSPTRIDGPDSRYVTPGPVVVGGCSPAGLCPIEITGPVAVRYSMSREATHFAAEAVLPRSAARFGDYELIIRSDDEVLFHQRLNVASPRARINVPVSGSELIIEITEGANGPIQDQLLLNHAMLLVK